MQPVLQIVNRPVLEIVNQPALQIVNQPVLEIINRPRLIIKHLKCNSHNTRLCNYDDCEYCYNRSFAASNRLVNWSDRNNKSPREIFLRTNRKYWFNCDKCPHEFEASLCNIFIGRWCPYCSSKKLCNDEQCKHCFDKSFSSHEKSKYWSNKNDVSSREVFLGSEKRFWFNCDKCPHDFNIRLASVNRGNWCSYCSGNEICDNNGCFICFNKSFASHEKSKYWSDRNDKLPREVFLKSCKKFWFNCDQCTHEFDISPNHINNVIRGTWCPYCAGKKLCNNNDCHECFIRSFASHDKSICWSNRNNKSPREVSLNSNTKFWFNCDRCPHDFDASLGHINGGRYCPYCSDPPQKLCSDDNCSHCFNNSFASHEKAEYWSEKNNINPRYIFKCARNEYWFKCDNNCSHEFKSALYAVISGSWCPMCKNKTEKKLYKILSQHYQVTYQPRYDWCVSSETNRHFPFDYEIPEYKIIIELDGDQHFRQIWNWQSPEENRSRDIYKMDCANKNGYTVIRIYQMDVFKDKNEWLVKLTDAIKNYETPTRLFISSGDHYDNHMNP